MQKFMNKFGHDFPFTFCVTTMHITSLYNRYAIIFLRWHFTTSLPMPANVVVTKITNTIHHNRTRHQMEGLSIYKMSPLTAAISSLQKQMFLIFPYCISLA